MQVDSFTAWCIVLSVWTLCVFLFCSYCEIEPLAFWSAVLLVLILLVYALYGSYLFLRWQEAWPFGYSLRSWPFMPMISGVIYAAEGSNEVADEMPPLFLETFLPLIKGG